MTKHIRITTKELTKIVEEAEQLYNRYRAPESIAEILEITNDEIIVKFKGSFCKTCGLYDWIEDMKYILKDLGVNTEIVGIVNMDNDAYIGVFKVHKLRKIKHNYRDRRKH